MSVLTPFDAFEAPGWIFQDDCGYYIHQGRVYLQGLIYNDYGYSSVEIGRAILNGLPAECRPTADRAVLLYVDTADTADQATPGVQQTWTPLPATVTAAGDLSLDALPPYLNRDASPPDPPYRYFNSDTGLWVSDFGGGLPYYIVLGNTSWALDADQIDNWTRESFAPYLADYYLEDIDSTIGIDGNRVHLGGRVRVLHDHPYSLVNYNGLPDKYLTGVSSLGYGHRSYTVAEGPQGEYALAIDGQGKDIQILSDYVQSQWSEPPPDDWGVESYPGQNPGDGGIYHSIETPGIWVPSGLYTHDGPQGPHSFFGYIAGGARGQRQGGSGPGYPSDQTPVGNHNVGATHDNGTYEITAYGETGGGFPGAFHETQACPLGGPSASLVASIEDILADFYPVPDWFGIAISLDVAWTYYTEGQAPDYTLPLYAFASCGPYGPGPTGVRISADAGCILVDGNTGLDIIAEDGAAIGALPRTIAIPPFVHAGTAPIDLGEGTGGENDGGGMNNLQGCLAHPGRAISYPYDQGRKSTTMLWHPDEIHEMTVEIIGDTHWSQITMDIQLYPFWEERRHHMVAGDVLDLTGAGWQSDHPVLPGSTVAAGDFKNGTVRDRAHTGVQS